MGTLPNQAETALGEAPVHDADPFSPEALRVAPDDLAAAGVRREFLSVPVRKPNKQEFVRVRPGPDWRLDTMVLELREDRETYLVAPGLREELAAEGRVAALYTCVSRGGALFLWPVPLPGPTGGPTPGTRARTTSPGAPRSAGRAWCRTRPRACTRLLVATGLTDEPDWPDLTFRQGARARVPRAVDRRRRPPGGAPAAGAGVSPAGRGPGRRAGRGARRPASSPSRTSTWRWCPGCGPASRRRRSRTTGRTSTACRRSGSR
jgi:hypothetical protein